MPSERDAVEAEVREILIPRVAEYLELADEWDVLAKAVLDTQSGAGVTPHVGVKALLLARVANDLRATAVLAKIGYPLQAWTTASSAFEMAHDIGFIGLSDERAERWLTHVDLTKRHWPVFDAVKATYADLELDPELVPREYQHYRYLCLAKHGNPIIQAGHNLVDSGTAITLRIDPYASNKVVKQLRLGLALAMRATSYGTWMTARRHVGDEDLLQSVVNATGRTIKLLGVSLSLADLADIEKQGGDAV